MNGDSKMKDSLRRLVKRMLESLDRPLKSFDIGITSYKRLQWLEKSRRTGDLIDVLLELPESDAAQLLKCLRDSKSSYGEDLFALFASGYKTDGYFVEFGAADGILYSNSWILEKAFQWRGIVAEPARMWHEDLGNNRKCHIEKNCVWTESDSTLPFRESVTGFLSTIETFSSSDYHSGERREGKSYNVKTISLEDLLDKYNAPKKIDFLSIDTEGSEFDILNAFDFRKYQFGAITCEHNFTPQRDKIHSLLTQNGYVRKFEKISHCDDWYVLANAES